MKRIVLIILLSAGTIAGFAWGARSLAHRYHHGHDGYRGWGPCGGKYYGKTHDRGRAHRDHARGACDCAPAPRKATTERTSATGTGMRPVPTPAAPAAAPATAPRSPTTPPSPEARPTPAPAPTP